MSATTPSRAEPFLFDARYDLQSNKKIPEKPNTGAAYLKSDTLSSLAGSTHDVDQLRALQISRPAAIFQGNRVQHDDRFYQIQPTVALGFTPS